MQQKSLVVFIFTEMNRKPRVNLFMQLLYLNKFHEHIA